MKKKIKAFVVDDEEVICRKINYQKKFLKQEIEHLKEGNLRFQKREKGPEES